MPDFDAIVIGSGMSGGWAAKELCERGLKVLVLERGREIDPSVDFTDMIPPWERPNLDQIPEDEVKRHYWIQHAGARYAVSETSKHFWVKDDEHPYETPEGRPFDWLRGYHTGGRSIMWGRQSYRLGPQDFESNKQDGHGVDWPIRYADLAPWYDHVERFAGIAGDRDGLPHLPDGIFQPAFALTAGEKSFKQSVERAFPTRKVIAARVANLTEPTAEQIELGRSQCRSRNFCQRGCAFSAYFSSVSATLPAAARTGNYTLVSNAIVQQLDYDPATRRISGVRVIDALTKQGRTYTARMVFLNASTIPSTMILLNSASEDFPDGLANRSGQLGRNLMDHVSPAITLGVLPGNEDRYHAGRSPGSFYIPRYANITEPDGAFVRGFGFQGAVRRIGARSDGPGVGADFKNGNRKPGPWHIWILPFGEMLPDPNNRITLHASRRDAWGMPVPVIDCVMGPNEHAMMARAALDAKAMLVAAGADIIEAAADAPVAPSAPGNRIHEMGTARMGADPAQSVLNGWCQAHDVDNLFVTDGACMPSGGCQNPSLTYMALTARAAHHAADLARDGVL